MGALSPWHLILVLLVALLVLGPGKLPEAGAAIGKAVREFRDAVEGHEEAVAAGSIGSTASSYQAAPPFDPATVTAPAAPPVAAAAPSTAQAPPPQPTPQVAPPQEAPRTGP